MTKSLTQTLLDWFYENARDLPWRKEYLPYHVWVSEIMLQQTQMNRAVEYFHRWVSRFPNIPRLAAASENDVLKAWEGLGYYSRARNIHKAAKIITHDYNGTLPAEYKLLLQLPGIGPYTAAAIMSLAFNQDYPVVDANVERIFSRLFNIKGPIKRRDNKKEIYERAQKLLPPDNARNFNQAMMELGALICKPYTPLCTSCPIRSHCVSLRLSIVDKRPERPIGKEIIRIDMATGLLVHEGKIFIQKRLPTDVWANLWEFAGGRLKQGESPQETVIREYQEETELAVSPVQHITTVAHSYMNYRVTLHGFLCHLQGKKNIPVLHAAQEYQWIAWKDIKKYAFPAGHKKVIRFVNTSPEFLSSVSAL